MSALRSRFNRLRWRSAKAKAQNFEIEIENHLIKVIPRQV